VTILSHPLAEGIVSMPEGFPSLYVELPTIIVNPLPLHAVESIMLEELGKKVSMVVTMLSHPLPESMVSIPDGFDSSYVELPTVIVSPLPLHDVESIVLEE